MGAAPQNQPFADVLQNRCSIFKGKHLRWNIFSVKLQAFRLQRSCFPVNIAIFLRTTFFKEYLWRLLVVPLTLLLLPPKAADFDLQHVKV